MKRYERKFNEEKEILFYATSRGARAFVQAEVDSDSGFYSVKTDGMNGDAKDLKDVKNKVMNQLIQSVVSDYGDVYKVENDNLGISKYWIMILNFLKKYKYLKLSPKGSEERKFYYSIVWYLSDAFRLSKGNNYDSLLKKVFATIDKQVSDKGY